MANEQEGPRERWRIDKHIPLAMILAIFIQTCAVVWWAGSLSERVANLERRQVGIDQDRASLVDVGKRLERMDERLSSQKDILTEIRMRLDRFQAPPRQEKP